MGLVIHQQYRQDVSDLNYKTHAVFCSFDTGIVKLFDYQKLRATLMLYVIPSAQPATVYIGDPSSPAQTIIVPLLTALIAVYTFMFTEQDDLEFVHQPVYVKTPDSVSVTAVEVICQCDDEFN